LEPTRELNLGNLKINLEVNDIDEIALGKVMSKKIKDEEEIVS
jgi:hypothetical protein